jgi:GTP-binding protein Era
MIKKKDFKSGFIGLVGRTNVGKSTLVNRIIGKKVVITSDKAQTTRSRINCILNTKDHQMIFIDCPGFFKPRNMLGKKLNNTVLNVIDDSDLIVVMVDTAGGIGSGDFYIFDYLKTKPQQKILLLNKIDLVSKQKIKKEEEKLGGYDFFDDIHEVSAKTGQNVAKFLKTLEKKLPEGPRYYGKGTVTDQPTEEMISEVVREKLYQDLYDEVPHSINVRVEDFKKTTTGKGKKLISIRCCIYAERESQKAIIIGKSGSMLKKAGKQSRLELENIFGCKVFLELWVKIEKNWTRKKLLLEKFGYM